MKHFWHAVKAAMVVVAAAVPMILANPSVGHYIAQHPSVAAYFPLVVGIVHAIAKAAAGKTAH